MAQTAAPDKRRAVVSNPGPGELQGLLVFVVTLHLINQWLPGSRQDADFLFLFLFFKFISDFIPFSPNLVANLTPISSITPPPCYLLRSTAYTSPPGSHS